MILIDAQSKTQKFKFKKNLMISGGINLNLICMYVHALSRESILFLLSVSDMNTQYSFLFYFFTVNTRSGHDQKTM